MPPSRLTFENPWISAVDTARRPGRGWIVLVIGALTVAVAVVGGRALGSTLATIAAGRMAGPWSEIVQQGLFYLCVFTPLWLVAAVAGVLEGRSVWRAEPRFPAMALAGAAMGAAGFGLAVALAWMTHVVTEAPPSLSLAGGVLAGALLVLFQAGAEEIFFRGWIQPVLCARVGPWVGLIVTAALFAALHMVGGARGPLSIVNLLLGGLWFGLLALRTGGLWTALGAHWAWNWTESCGLGLDPNPGVGPTGALIDFDLVGPTLWSGGADGMNGSLATTIVLAVLIVGVMTWTPRQTQG